MEEENEKKAVRIFVGGLGEAVTTEDLHRLFESLGTVQSLETIRTKGRSLAYLDFLSDPKSLSKLFSKYNGCVWKGGKLRLEKAKVDYLSRLKKEWEEEALLSKQLSTTDKVDLEEKLPNTRLVSNSDENAKLLKIFFPRLRKVKSIPFSGSGKHKYSFQNIKVPQLPVHFCDCEEHCSPFVREREKVSLNGAAEIGGMKDEEINIMNAVMNKLLEKEKVSNTKHHEKEQDSFEAPDALQVNECEIDSATDDDDDDDLIINIETKKNKVIDSQELQRIMKNQESRSNKTNTAEDKSTLQVQKRSNSNLNKVKNKKAHSKLESESKSKGVSSTPADKSKMQTLIDELGSGAHPTESEYDFGESGKASWSQKSSWRELVGKGGNTAFSASLILPKFDSDKDQQNSDDSCTPSSTNDETENMESDEYPGSEPTGTQVIEESDSDKDQQKSDDCSTPSFTNDETEDMESDEYLIEEPDSDEDQQKSDASFTPSFTNDETKNMESEGDSGSQPTNPQVIEEPTEAQPTTKTISEPGNTQHNVAPVKTGRGASWLQKQSWTQLVSEQDSSFSITQILPGITFPEPKTMAPMVDTAVSNDCKHDVVVVNKNTIPENGEHAGGDDIASAPVIEKKIETNPREKSTEYIEIGETCSFMRNAASLKEWAKAKAAVSASLKRKRGEK